MAFFNEEISISVGAYQIKIDSSDTTGDYLINKLLAGTNITLTEGNIGLDETLTINASGGSSVQIETPSGTINGSNTVFTVSYAPIFIFVDGVAKFVTLNYTYSTGTITITDGAPPTVSIESAHN